MKTATFIEEQKAANAKAEKPEKRHKTGFRGPSPDVGKATQFKPGVCANPGGRRKQDWAADIARAVFENNGEAIYKAMLKPLLNGNAYAFKELAERAYGKMKERHELTGPDGRPIQYQDVSDEDLQKRVDDLMRELGLVRAIDDAGELLPGEGR
jgi:hypothetical protein